MRVRWFSTTNSKFDARFISRYAKIKWPWHLTNDTMTMAHLLDPLRPKGLKPLGSIHVDKRAAGAQRMLDDGMTLHKWTWATVPDDFPPYWIYGAMDPVITCYLYEKFHGEVMEKYREPYELEMGTTRIVAAMEALGARVDLAYADSKRTELVTWANSAKDWLRDAYGVESASSNVQLLKFFQTNGVPMLAKATNSGAQSMDKEVLESIDHDVARTVLAIRKAEKTVGPYFDNFLKMADENDRLHPNIWTMGTRTSRMSVSDPALQTLPRKDPTVRKAFIPSEGNYLITCDYDQIEARLTAHFSQDVGLIAAFNSPDDFFCAVASNIFGEPISKGDERRQLTKGVVYGKIYGAGVEKMAQTAGVTDESMGAVVGGFDGTYPGVKQMQKAIERASSQRAAAEGVAYVVTPTGRRMVADEGKGYTLTNYLIQCHAAEILKRKMQELDAVLPEGVMILPVHDELVFDVPADDADDLKQLIVETMADPTTYAVPITASADILTTNWGSKYSA